ncbi:hypothetical protein CMO88_02465 [Candidatus Woesearchaeota archaeon]|nr:hypothetical protein [Candidatus Woesearchaeota archaeon]|tara:strand:+ start:7704 stop:8147 length:444 start_codon:yes stop_codon:yes gene_type:complete
MNAKTTFSPRLFIPDASDLETELREIYPDHEIGLIHVNEEVTHTTLNAKTIIDALAYVQEHVMPDYNRRITASPFGSPVPEEMTYPVSVMHTDSVGGRSDLNLSFTFRYFFGLMQTSGVLFQEANDERYNLVNLHAMNVNSPFDTEE